MTHSRAASAPTGRPVTINLKRHTHEKEKRNITTDFPTEKNANLQEVAKLLPGAIPTDLPLQEQLDRVTQASATHLPEEMAKLLKSYLEYLVTSGLTENALKENELAPDFTLPDALVPLLSSRE